MKLFKSPEHRWNEAELALLDKASKRVQKTTSEQMMLWADLGASGVMRALEDFMQYEDKASLDELTEGVIMLQAVVKELSERYHLTREV
jgi:hypothetical protein